LQKEGYVNNDRRLNILSWDFLKSPFHKHIEIQLEISDEFMDKTVDSLEGFSAR